MDDINMQVANTVAVLVDNIVLNKSSNSLCTYNILLHGISPSTHYIKFSLIHVY